MNKIIIENAVRAVQCLFSIIVLACAASAYPTRHNLNREFKLTSNAVNLVLVTSFAAVIYTGIWLVGTFILGAQKPKLACSALADSAIALLYFIGGIMSAVSDHVQECKLYGHAIHCATLKTVVAFAFFSFVVFALTAGYELYVISKSIRVSKEHHVRQETQDVEMNGTTYTQQDIPEVHTI